MAVVIQVQIILKLVGFLRTFLADSKIKIQIAFAHLFFELTLMSPNFNPNYLNVFLHPSWVNKNLPLVNPNLHFFTFALCFMAQVQAPPLVYEI